MATTSTMATTASDPQETSSQEFKQLPWYRFRSPVVQNLICSIVMAMTPGIFLCLTNIGAGGGKPNSTVFANHTNVILYAIFTFTSVLAGPCVNIFGPRACLAFGTTGYAMYVGGLWYFGNTGNMGFPLFGGAYLGVTAGFLWVSAGYTSQAYAPEKRKAWFIAMQWSIICLGSTIGGAIAVSVNYNKSKSTGVGAGVYGAFLGIHLLAGIIAATCIVDPRTVRRNDGTYLAVFPHPSLKEELSGMWETLHNPNIMMHMFAGFTLDLWLPILGSWNAYTFSLRARSLNTMMLYLIQIPSAWFFQWIVANNIIKSRRTRIMVVLSWTALINVAAWGAWLGYIKSHNYNRHVPGPGLDWKHGAAWAKPFVIYLFLGIMAPTMRNFVLYMCSIASNDPTKQSRYNGILHAMPQAGICVAFGVDSAKVPYIISVSVFLGLTLASIATSFFGVWKYTPETLWGQEDNVIVPKMEAKALGLPADGQAHHVGEKEASEVNVATVR